jgi:hypothetical protein
MSRPGRATQLITLKSAIRKLGLPRWEFFNLCRDVGLPEFRCGRRMRLFRLKDINHVDAHRKLTISAR